MMIRIAGSCLLTFALCGCASGGAPPEPQTYGSGDSALQMPEPECGAAAPTFAQVAAFQTCVMCHASTKAGADRHSAPMSVNFDTEAGADAVADRAVLMVKGGLMPPSGSGLALNDTEKQQLYEWVMCRM
jgi:uncharacterized membrane protein